MGLGAADEEQPEFDLRRYLSLAIRFRWILLASVSAALCAGYFFAQSRPVVYRASASIVIEREAPRVLGTRVEEAVNQGVRTWTGDRDAYYNSQLSIIRSQRVRALAVKAGGLLELPAVAGLGSPQERYGRAVSAVASVQLNLAKDEEVLWITATHRDPEAAAAVANAVVLGYQQYSFESYRDGNSDASVWLAKQLDAVEGELRQTEGEILQFKKQHDLLSLSLEDRRNLLAREIEHFSHEASRAKTERLAKEAERKRFREVAAQDISTSPIFRMAESRNGLNLREKFLEAEVEGKSLAAEYGPQHPIRLKQEEKIAGLRVSMEAEAKLILQSIDAAYQESSQVESQLSLEVEKLKAQAFALAPTEVEHNALRRKYAETEERAKLLRERHRSNDLAARLQATNIHPLDSASAPAIPIEGGLRSYLISAGLIGLMGGIGLIALILMFDSKVRTVQQVEDLCASEFVGALPVSPDPRRESALGDSQYEEAMRIVRTNLSFLAPDVDIRRLLVTSPQPRDGKSTTAYGLARSYAQLGKKVVLVDADLRGSAIHSLLGIPRRDGLSELILGEISVEKALRTSDQPGLHIIPAGGENPHPAEALASKRFTAILEDLSARFDILVIDTPPTLPVTDASLLVHHVDVTLAVVRCGETDKHAIAIALRQLRLTRPACLGVIANAVDARAAQHAYAGYSGYGYTYGHASRAPEAAGSRREPS